MRGLDFEKRNVINALNDGHDLNERNVFPYPVSSIKHPGSDDTNDINGINDLNDHNDINGFLHLVSTILTF
jgi:hypothetical protein